MNIHRLADDSDQRVAVRPRKHKRIRHNCSRVRRIYERASSYARFTLQALQHGVRPLDLVRTQFPFVLPTARMPPVLSVELTNVCNLRCTSCHTTLRSRPNGVMKDAVFERLVADVAKFNVQRVKLIGGEPTLHPKFPELIRRLAEVTPYLQLVTNGHWRNQDIPEAIIEAPVQLIEISIDAGGTAVYEHSRQGGSYQAVLASLRDLAERKRLARSRSVINVRLMLRPSTAASADAERQFYQQFADTVMVQHLLEVDRQLSSSDMFEAKATAYDEYPKCTLPLKSLEVKWDGTIPICGPNGNNPNVERISLGNILTTDLQEAWHSVTLERYRSAHRTRRFDGISICQGCRGV